ncbi:hypothetical protein AYO38_07840 [bacterium SCGC AG-212-C10]|nr:hypothetical protein AYO38_07840 [bacterium SCGC AG-212-C10]
MAISSRTRLLTLGLSAIIAVGVIGGATATFAREGGGDPTTPATAGERPQHPRAAIALTLRQIATTCGLTRDELKTGFQDGLSINGILTAKGEDPAECQANVLASIQSKLDELVANGKITAERAEAIAAKAADKLPELMAKVPERPHHPRRMSTN